tara:strand:- start:632 stop:775 length:144 start_codon:yes stop_codon:yes gene_type:complete
MSIVMDNIVSCNIDPGVNNEFIWGTLGRSVEDLADEVFKKHKTAGTK